MKDYDRSVVRVVQRFLNHGLTVRDIAEGTGLSRSFVYKCMKVEPKDVPEKFSSEAEKGIIRAYLDRGYVSSDLVFLYRVHHRRLYYVRDNWNDHRRNMSALRRRINAMIDAHGIRGKFFDGWDMVEESKRFGSIFYDT